MRYVTVTNRGNSYTSIPRVAISSAPSGGLTAVGIATMIGGIVDCNGTSSLKVQGVEIINPGYGYTVAPSVVFLGGGGAGAAATTIIGNGIVGIITLTNGGSGYATAPIVTINPPSSGTTATARAKINSVGIVTQISITNAGSGYTSSPTISISSPYMIGVGTYIYNEIIVGSISSTTARVRDWNATTGSLEVYEIDGTFVNGDIIVGTGSSAIYKLRQLNTNNVEDAFASNAIIEEEADTIIDFSETNPFGIP